MRTLPVVVFLILTCGCTQEKTVTISAKVFETVGNTSFEQESKKFLAFFAQEMKRSRIQQSEVPIKAVKLVLDKEAGITCCIIRVILQSSAESGLFELITVHLRSGETSEDAASIAALVMTIIKDPHAEWRRQHKPKPKGSVRAPFLVNKVQINTELKPSFKFA